MANREAIDLYTVVQHSGFGYNGDLTFKNGLESRNVTTKADKEKVEKAGGLLFDSYGEAEDFAESASYPKGYTGMTPNAQGEFARDEIDGLRIYIPIRESRVIG